jgi:hypothetical protein
LFLISIVSLVFSILIFSLLLILGAQPRWADKKPKKGKEEKKASNGSRIIVFVIGGVTYSEMRTAYELSNKLGRQVTKRKKIKQNKKKPQAGFTAEKQTESTKHIKIYKKQTKNN